MSSTASSRTERLRGIIRSHKRWDMLFGVLGLGVLLLAVMTLIALFTDMIITGVPRLTGDFFTSFPSRRAADAGILSAWIGSLLVMFVTALVAVPLGIAGAIYLEEYARKNWFTDIIELNVSNLAGVPSIIYGLLALGLFVYGFGLGQSILTAGLTLALLILPIGALTFIAFLPPLPGTGEPPAGMFDWLFSPFTVMPIQIFNWTSRPDPAFHHNAAAASFVLLAMTMCMNGFAIWLRYRLRKNIKW